MERHYGLPIAFAAAAHAALLFGFEKSPRAAALKPAETTFITCVFPVPPPEPEPPMESEASSAKSLAAAAPEVPLPGLPEPLTLDLTGGPTMAPPPLRPVSTSDITQILPGSFGTPGDGEGWRKNILSGLELDNPPRTRFQPAPIYPFESKRDGIKGEVHVEFLVDESGLVRDPRVIASSHRMFDEPTLRAVAKWRFEPGRRHGRVVAFKMAVPVVFSLND